MQLRNGKDDVKYGCHDFEAELPFRPGLAEENEDHYCLGHGAYDSDEEGAKEDIGEKSMVIGEDTVEDEGYIEPKFGEYVKGACSAWLVLENNQNHTLRWE